MSKHTKGPWKTIGAYIGTDEDDTQTVAYCSDHRNREGRVQAETDANAHLIAAAPDLLAACEDVEWVMVPAGMGDAEFECPWCQGRKHDGHYPDCQRQATIARARGES